MKPRRRRLSKALMTGLLLQQMSPKTSPFRRRKCVQLTAETQVMLTFAFRPGACFFIFRDSEKSALPITKVDRQQCICLVQWTVKYRCVQLRGGDAQARNVCPPIRSRVRIESMPT
ncbi:hypothetical protein AVEN_92611-1 [Araneus ventricosus]|uniref:Uncharacterized protein n=1 Tax=Araneus ventricosus TaxID=182803 RepID=A0A4Y2AI00_ARAVE|nr:hypothetical protein AVEN_92611-1 [Araneus ventricosus]